MPRHLSRPCSANHLPDHKPGIVFSLFTASCYSFSQGTACQVEKEPEAMIKVLIVDDDQMNCDLLQSVFTRQGCHVISTTSGREGLDLFRAHNPRVTLLDLRMPEMDGLTVLKEIRAIDPHAPVIILGGGATEIQENQARALRATDFIRKGLSLEVLVEAVNRHSKLPTPSTATQSPVGNGDVIDQIDESAQAPWRLGILG